MLKGITHERLARSLRLDPRISNQPKVRTHHGLPGDFVSSSIDKLANSTFGDYVNEEQKGIRPSRNTHFNSVVQELIDMHDKKNHDYANEDNPFSNFDIAVQYLKRRGINLTPNQQIESMKGTKFARLVNIVLNDIENPNFESEDDSELDFVVYYLLARAEAKRTATTTL